jgi:hypothetical protein
MTDTTNPQPDGLFVPPAADGLPLAALDSATAGADRLDAMALTPYGRNLLAHALVQLARDGWLRAEPGAGFESVRDRETPDPLPVSGPGGAADETRQPVPADRPAIRAAAFDEAAAKLAGLDPVKAALAGQHAWNVAAGIVRHMAVQERRMADGEQQPETQADDGPRCTCADAGPAFAPAGHYADCPQAEQPAVEHCIHDRTVHRTHHKQAPVTGCPWCTAATSTED